MEQVVNTYETIRYEVKDFAGIITLNRPKVNAVNEQMTKDVWNALDRAEKDPSVRAVIMTGANNVFSAGGDLKEAFDLPTPIGDEPSEVYREQLETFYRVALKMWDLKKPVIAAVDGYALGVAADWVFSADVAIASNQASIGEPEIRFGAAPATLMMPWVIGIRKAKELLYTGDSVDAEEGYRLGIFNRVVPKEQLMDEAMKMAEKMAQIPPSALKITKMTVNKTYEMMNLKQALDYNLETAISMFFLNQEQEIAEAGRVLREEGLSAFLKGSK
ncbi:enoyl-CoA hydratase/isomerase family protein [Metabacillus arenae]|uniref:Enoyl-CoA hydratase/isomerase family protein n=1 Tax=Metabacillus arenae TaxID=2771434 RepID=A0A926NKG0_9BACI|nr:enoyl-CoA hydratase/isomerase family protein [Metabacillus arenae]MBD1382705.1 enoyl-CoA hydratase/isomerase family protein [Metabacillus arenae]